MQGEPLSREMAVQTSLHVFRTPPGFRCSRGPGGFGSAREELSHWLANVCGNMSQVAAEHCSHSSACFLVVDHCMYLETCNSAQCTRC